MAWTTPKTMGSELGTSADWNTHVRDNLLDLHRRTTAELEYIPGNQTTTSTTYTNLATVGPSATCTVGTTGLVLVILYAAISNTNGSTAGYMSVELSGAVSEAASDANSLAYSSFASGAGHRGSAVIPMTPAGPGTITFTAKYRTDGGTATFGDRRIVVIPLGA